MTLIEPTTTVIGMVRACEGKLSRKQIKNLCWLARADVDAVLKEFKLPPRGYSPRPERKHPYERPV